MSFTACLADHNHQSNLSGNLSLDSLFGILFLLLFKIFLIFPRVFFFFSALDNQWRFFFIHVCFMTVIYCSMHHNKNRHGCDFIHISKHSDLKLQYFVFGWFLPFLLNYPMNQTDTMDQMAKYSFHREEIAPLCTSYGKFDETRMMHCEGVPTVETWKSHQIPSCQSFTRNGGFSYKGNGSTINLRKYSR